ncbi:TolC family protein, partial [Candidatus Dependentiae bacterium]
MLKNDALRSKLRSIWEGQLIKSVFAKASTDATPLIPESKIRSIQAKRNKFIRHAALCLITLVTTLSHITNQAKTPEPQDYAIYKPITLEEVVDLAYLHRQDLEGFDYIVKANWYAERSALGGFLPQISITADSGNSSISGVSGVGLIPRESVVFNVSQLIFSADGPMFQYKIAQEETNISRAQRESLQNSIRFNSESSFLELKKEILKNKLIASLDDSSVETFDQEITRKKVGFLNRTQWENAQADFSRDQTDVKNYPLTIDAATSRLQRETNSPINLENVSLAYKDLDKLSNFLE